MLNLENNLEENYPQVEETFESKQPQTWQEVCPFGIRDTFDLLKLKKYNITDLRNARLVGFEPMDVAIDEDEFKTNQVLSGFDLSGAIFEMANLVNISFEGCVSLKGANFTDASLWGTSFKGVDLSGAKFNKSKVMPPEDIDFSGANLSGVHFGGKDLSASEFSGAKFDEQTDLEDALLPAEVNMQLPACIQLKTRMPILNDEKKETK